MPSVPRPVARTFPGVETLEGAGVRLRRQFGNPQVPLFDPFLLLDNFGSTRPEDYMAGFPWHPHRGIETVTYMLEGQVAHGDSLGNQGVIGQGDVQWMSAGSGIIHQEMPQRQEHGLSGFQLWVNLPRHSKMSVPEYRGLSAPELPTVTTDAGASVKVVAGQFGNVEGPVRHISVEPVYLDVTLAPENEFVYPTQRGHTAFAHTIEGAARFNPNDPGFTERNTTVLFDDGDEVRVRSGAQGSRFLLVSGRPLHEPVAWYGPIVMNRPEELVTAMRELRNGEFVKTPAAESD
jgi:quercetin 2,3-dioxygenase